MYLVITRPSERACLHNPPSPPSTIDRPFSSRFTILRFTRLYHRIEKRRNRHRPPRNPKFFPSIFPSIVKIFQRGKGGWNALDNSKVSTTVKLPTVLG